MSKIIIIDDDEGIISLIKIILDRQGYDIEAYMNIEEAMDSLNNYPAVAIIDKNLPGMSGDKFIESYDFGNTVPIIMTAQIINSKIRDEMKRQGAFYVLGKPFSVKRLLSIVEMAVQFNKAMISSENSQKISEDILQMVAKNRRS